MNKNPYKQFTQNVLDMKAKVYPGKKLCVKCHNNYHPENFDMCWNCWSSQLSNTTKSYKGNEEGYASVKDWQESI